jgi:hypothetical protein
MRTVDFRGSSALPSWLITHRGSARLVEERRPTTLVFIWRDDEPIDLVAIV